MSPLASVQTMSLERLPCASHQAAASSVSRGSESIVANVWLTAQLYRPTIGRRSSCVAGRISNGLVAFAEGFVFAISGLPSEVPWIFDGLGGRAPAALKPASRGPAPRRHASDDALLAAPPFPWLRP